MVKIHEESLATFEKKLCVPLNARTKYLPGQLLISSHQVCFASKTLNKFRVQCRAARRPSVTLPEAECSVCRGSSLASAVRGLASHSIQMNCLFGQWDETTLCAPIRRSPTCLLSMQLDFRRWSCIGLGKFFCEISVMKLIFYAKDDKLFLRRRTVCS